MDEEKLDKIITEALCIEAEDAKKAGSVGFMARALTQATMPHKRIQGSEFTRDNGLLQYWLPRVLDCLMASTRGYCFRG